MKTNISEDLPARRFSPATSSSAGESGDSASGGNMEKRARQLVYDSKYQVKKSMGPDSKMDPAAVVRAVLERIDKSEYSQPIKARARKIVLGDSQKKEVKESASYSVARALYSVFVEQPSKLIDEEYIEKLKKELSEADQSPEERKYKVRVTDKETGNSYIRWANRSKINELRANPNIASVEMLDLYGSPEPNESERTKGSQTASVKAGKGLKNNDGNLANNYPPYNKVTRGDVIAGATGNDQMGGKRKVKEEFIGEKDNGDKEIKPMKGGKSNCVTVHDPSGPESGKGSGSGVGGREGLMAHNELEGKVISETGYTQFLKAVKSLQEKAESEQQQKLFGLALSVKRGETPRSEVSAEVLKIVDTMSEKKIRDFAKTKHEGLSEKVKEEMEGYSGKKKKKDGCEDDSRSKYAENQFMKNVIRAGLGIKNPIIMPVMTAGYEPEGEQIDEEMPKRVRGRHPSGTTTFTGRGGPFGRRKDQKKNPKRIFPEPKNPNDDDEDYYTYYNFTTHPSLTPPQRNLGLIR